jgi:microcystin-dependent protein
MPLTDADWGEVQNLVEKMIGKAGVQPFVQADVAKVDELKRLIYVAELADVPIPMVDFRHEVKTYHSVDPGTPIGAFYQWPTSVAPTNHVMLDGQSLVVADFSELHAVLGYDHGGSGANFNVPNWKGRVPVHRDSAQAEFDVLHEAGGAKTHTLSTPEIPSHTHIQNPHSHTGGIWVNLNPSALGGATSAPPGSGTGSGTVTDAATPTNQNAGGGGAHNNLQPYKVTNFIMRAKASSGAEEPQVEVQKRITTLALPEIGETVLIGMVMGERRMPRCLGVISAPASYLVHPGEL